MPNYRSKQWLEGPYDEKTKAAIRALSPEELEDAFSKDLSFGTAGMRGIVGVGSNRLNVYTIRAATQGLCNYINRQPDHPKRVVIGYDCRTSSPEFAEETAKVLIGNGIEALVCPKLMPSPFISFTCRYKKCVAGIMITASHNPSEYNGYKVYWQDGAQVTPPHDLGIISEVHAIKDPTHVRIGSTDDPHYQIIDQDVIDAYLKAIYPLQNLLHQNQEQGSKLNIIYTPLHGAGISLVPEALTCWGFTSLGFVESQKKPDGNFPSTPSPNPENPQALSLGMEQLKQTQADILIANDPDADRIGAVILHQNTPRFLTGNELATLICHHLLTTKAGHLPDNGAIIHSIVTTEILNKIAKTYGIATFEVLTGFKYIGELIKKWEKSHEHTFILGAEESHGYLFGTYARDKDGIATACLLAEMALDAKLQGQTLLDRLEAIYAKYGFHTSKLINIQLKDASCLKTIDFLRSEPPKTIAGLSLLEIEDYQSSKKRHLPTGKLTTLSLPVSNVLVLRLEKGIKLIIRPSGTEPKLKIYGAAHGDNCQALLDTVLNEAKDWFI
ncbi:MAG: phospho-sugar mutase [Chlamydiia bacterium]|nr:phospho-sugar mutase [Chlamydiia bacterium]